MNLTKCLYNPTILHKPVTRNIIFTPTFTHMCQRCIHCC